MKKLLEKLLQKPFEKLMFYVAKKVFSNKIAENLKGYKTIIGAGICLVYAGLKVAGVEMPEETVMKAIEVIGQVLVIGGLADKARRTADEVTDTKKKLTEIVDIEE